MTARVSVVIPVLDRAHCIGEAVAATLAQTGVEVECLVVDDGSTDDTVAVVEALAGADPRIRLLRNDRPPGPSGARNSGLAAATFELVAFHDSDDLMPAHRLQHQLAAQGDADGTFGQYEVVPGPVPPPAWLVERGWSRGWAWTSVLTARHHLDAVGGFDESLRLGEDLDLIVRLRGAGLRLDAVEEVVVEKRYFGDNLTNEVDAPGTAMGAAVRRHLRRRSDP